jgi:hypothetical protein
MSILPTERNAEIRVFRDSLMSNKIAASILNRIGLSKSINSVTNIDAAIMRTKKTLLLILLLLQAVCANAQQRESVEVRGTVISNSDRTPIEQATARLLNPTDSTLITGAVSARNGSFSIKDVKPGNYVLTVSYVGYETVHELLQITGRTNPVRVGNIVLKDMSMQLGEAMVVGRAAEVVVRNDTIEYNADSYKVAEGAVMEDLVKRMPGAEVSEDGTITVNGKEIQKVLVDGKEFFSDDPKVASKNLPANMIDKVQVLDRKSEMARLTGFDDGEEETVINLVVKPGMKEGWFGNGFAGYGSDDRYEGSLMINRFVNTDQMTLMGGLNNTNNLGFSDLASSMFQGMGSGGGGFRMAGGNSGITTSGNGGFNFAKDFNSKLTLNGNVRYNRSDNDAISSSTSETRLANDSIRYTDSQNARNRVNDNWGANLRLEWKPDTMTTIQFRPNFSYSQSHSWQTGSSSTAQGAVGNDLRDTLNTVDSRTSSDNDGLNLNGNLEISRKLNSKGRILTLEVAGGYNESNEKGANYSNTDYFDGTKDMIIDQQYDYTNRNYNYNGELSWVEPLGRNNFLQISYEYSRNSQESLRPVFLRNDDNGEYTVPDTSYIQKYNYNFTEHDASLSFRSQREKFNYTVGLDLNPYNSDGEIFKYDRVVERIERSGVNFAPMLRFNYMFTRQSNLRIDYNGRTSQPSMSQLQLVRDVTDPNNIVTGNPDLDPSFTHRFSVRFQRFVPEQQAALMIMADGNYVLDGIVSNQRNLPGGVRNTTYANVDGNYNATLRVMANSSIKWKGEFTKFSYNSMTNARFSNNYSFVDDAKARTQSLVLDERLGLNYRSNYFDVGISGNISYNRVNNSLQPSNNQNIFNYGGGGNTSLYFYNMSPWLPFSIESDLTYSTNSGYSSGYSQNEMMWNASVSTKPIAMLGGTGTFRVKMYDILKQRSNISNSISNNVTTFSRTNTLNSYFIVHFVYRFSAFKGGASQNDMRRNPRGGDRMRGPGGPPPGGAGGGRPPGL